MEKFSPLWSSALSLLIVAGLLPLSSCDRPRYDIKGKGSPATVQARPAQNTEPTSPRDPSPADSNPTEPGPQDLDCTSLTLTRSGAADFGAQGTAKSLPDYKKLQGKPLTTYFEPRTGEVIRRDLVVSDFNITPRMYSLGYPVSGKEKVLQDKRGRKLVENYGLRFEGYIALENPSAAGKYQFAMLADDGSLMEVFVNGKWQTLVDNQGPHSVKLACSNGAISLSGQSVLPFRMYYHQGPRLHIAHMLFWKKVEGFSQDEACGREGQKLFFDPSTQEPKSAYVEFMNRGWLITPVENFIYSSSKKSTHECFEKAKLKLNAGQKK